MTPPARRASSRMPAKGSSRPDEMPQTDEELLALWEEKMGQHIPTVAVCEDHDAPADFFCDAFFGRADTLVAIGSRSSGKTWLSSAIAFLSSIYKPGYETCILGAIEQQSKTALRHVKTIAKRWFGVDSLQATHDIEESLKSRFTFANGSEMTTLTASVRSVNSPHPHLTCSDEAELMEEDVWHESRQMSMAKDGYGACDLITSTRKYLDGRMQGFVDQYEAALINGQDPGFKLYRWCCMETAQNQADCCRVANPALAEGSKCNCHEVRSPEKWDDGSERTFDQICAGRLAKSDGWEPLQSLHKKFRDSTRSIWEAQRECTAPSTEGLTFVPPFSRVRHCIKGFEPRAEYGIPASKVFMSVDFGVQNPSAVLWFMVLACHVDVRNYYDQPRTLEPGTIVVFDEIYRAQTDSDELLDMILERERMWRKAYNWPARIGQRYYDVSNQGETIRMLWGKRGVVLSRGIGKDLDLTLGLVRSELRSDTLVIDVTPRANAGVVMLPKELESYRRENRGAVDHSIDALRYGLSGLKRLENEWLRNGMNLRGFSTKPQAAAVLPFLRSRPGSSTPVYQSKNSPYADFAKQDAPEVPIRDHREELLFNG
jgi:hypothetical protein